MSTCKHVLAITLAAFSLFFLYRPAESLSGFHNGGTGGCDGCHASHGTPEDLTAAINDQAPGSGNPYLLLGSDPTSTCLKCHTNPVYSGDQSVATYPPPGPGLPPQQLGPGGDFAYLQKAYSWTGPEGYGTSPGERHGHNVVALDFRGYQADGRLRNSPGGSYQSSHLSCISCHDPHGRYRINTDGTVSDTGAPIVGSGSYGAIPDATGSVGVYRLLGGEGYAPQSYSPEPFKYGPPVAVAPMSCNRPESGTDTRVAYGKGMSEWCANCHEAIHNSSYGPRHMTHPAGSDARLGAQVTSNYNAYVSTGDLSGTEAAAYASLVPFEEGSDDRVVLKARATSDGSAGSGPAAGANVMCLTCHRAHASCWDGIMRWNAGSEYVVFNGQFPGLDNSAPRDCSQGRTTAETRKAYYDRPPERFSNFQRSLCNKCHPKD